MGGGPALLNYKKCIFDLSTEGGGEDKRAHRQLAGPHIRLVIHERAAERLLPLCSLGEHVDVAFRQRMEAAALLKVLCRVLGL